MKKKICIITGSRAEYGLMQYLINKLHKDKKVDLKIFVTGMHLSPEFGNTYKNLCETTKTQFYNLPAVTTTGNIPGVISDCHKKCNNTDVNLFGDTLFSYRIK